MGKRKAQEDLSENVNTKRNRKYTARMDDERKATFNNQKALQTAITRSKQKLYQTDEFKEAGDDKRSQLEAATVQETIENRYVVVHVIVSTILTFDAERKRESSPTYLRLEPPNQKDNCPCTHGTTVIRPGKTSTKMWMRLCAATLTI